MSGDMIASAVTALILLGGFLGILTVGAVVADYILPRIGVLDRFIDSLPDYEDDAEVERKYIEDLRQRRIDRQQHRATKR